MLPQTRFARLGAPIVLAHGLFGFARIGVGRLTITSYFRGIPQALEEVGNRVLVTRVPAISGIETRSRRLGEEIVRAFADEPVHLIGHSMGGLDARHLLARPEWRGRVLSLTTIGTPHMGTALADFAKLRVGRIYRLMAALGIDPQGCLDVTRRGARRFHRQHPPPANLPCFSVAGDAVSETVSWPLERTFAALWELEGPNDGLVGVESALAFGTPLPLWPLDHLRQLNWLPAGENGSLVPPATDLYA
jgi:triacylglycerol lipase